ncbi:MAG: hypothetical protein M1838_004723 [Thelocarpon superellum]|nr:MAG: hypothetical protein M1838_004723 [Thelocarpon superellum]
MVMSKAPGDRSNTKPTSNDVRSEYEPVEPVDSREALLPAETHGQDSAPVHYRVYKRRWFGLIQLVLLNLIVSWDWLSFTALSNTSASYFGVSETAINWLSTAFLFAFCAVSPFVLWTINRGGPKAAIIIASVLILLGNWIRYAGTRTTGGHFGVVMFGQIVIGLAQPFVLTVPTRYSDLWFTSRGRISATALASLANPFGGALGQLINPFWASEPVDIPNMVLYVSIMATIASIPGFFIPAAPPSPPCASAAQEKYPVGQSLKAIVRSVEFWLIFIPFSVYVGFFNAFSTLLNQILSPYGFTEVQAGICGALLIVVGLVVSAITSSIFDRHNLSRRAIKVQVPIIGLCYLIFIWAPGTHTLAAPFIISSVLGAASFSLLPLALELLVEHAHPVSPEVTSVVCWTGSQLLGAIFLLIMNALKDDDSADPPYSMRRALLFEAAVALLVVPLPLCLGWFGRAANARSKRAEVDLSVMRPSQLSSL